MTLVAALAGVLASVPVDPDADEARRLLLDEVTKPEYVAAQPTWLDRISGAIGDWLSGLSVPNVGGGDVIGPFILLAILAAAVIAAFLIFGLPRLNKRSGAAGSLFGEDDARDASALRLAASSAASSGDYALAISEGFRAIARSLSERGLVVTTPGTTAHGFSQQAAAEFPAEADSLGRAAQSFDGVRYLGLPGREAEYTDLVELDARLRAARPQHDPTQPDLHTAVPA
ncbi:DUF4129 domain-containing protein [Glaciihabitans sp. dw_435]|uniref:DUF4129 domain-containing protein n=1 Tax=Glaciihabitans sp. dw_435 TaxID=2720081 RepID=UPI001BD2DAD5|nr:DUF4129 domain-containing protein [Glaciihabitans sp. dw_435]